MKRLLIVVATALTIGGAHVGAQQNRSTLEKRFASAEHKATVEGDLKGAIDEYKRIVADAGRDRSAAARALLRMAEAYQKLGNTEARSIYQRIVREFDDQPDAVAIASRSLDAGAAESREQLLSRRVWILDCTCDVFGNISPDGRYIPYLNYTTTSTGLVLHDLVSGSNRPLTAEQGGGVPASLTGAYSFSRDGKQLAYGWDVWDDSLRSQLRVVSLPGTGIPASRTLVDQQDLIEILPHDWSPDGKWIVVATRRKDRTAQIGLVSTADGSLRLVKTVDWRRPSHLIFSPDGKYLAFDLQGDIFILATDFSREVPAVVHPSNDVVVGWSPDGTKLLFTSDRAGTNGLWALSVSDGAPKGMAELIKRDMGEAMATVGMTTGGALHSVVYDGKTTGAVSGDILQATLDLSESKIVGAPAPAVATFVGTNRMPDWSPDGRHLAYLSRDFVVGIRSLATGETRELSLTQGMAYATSIRWGADSKSFIVVGTDAQGRGGIFRVDAVTGKTTLMVQPESGNRNDVFFATESPDGRFLYYRLRTAGTNSSPAPLFSVRKRDLVSGGEEELIRRSNLSDLSLSPDGRFLATALSDPSSKSTSVLVLSTNGNEPREVMRGQSLRVQTWAPDGQSLFVKKDTELWRVSVESGQSRKFDLALDGAWASFRVHPEGRQVAIQTSKPAKPAEVWVLENFLSAARR